MNINDSFVPIDSTPKSKLACEYDKRRSNEQHAADFKSLQLCGQLNGKCLLDEIYDRLINSSSVDATDVIGPLSDVYTKTNRDSLPYKPSTTHSTQNDWKLAIIGTFYLKIISFYQKQDIHLANCTLLYLFLDALKPWANANEIDQFTDDFIAITKMNKDTVLLAKTTYAIDTNTSKSRLHKTIAAPEFDRLAAERLLQLGEWDSAANLYSVYPLPSDPSDIVGIKLSTFALLQANSADWSVAWHAARASSTSILHMREVAKFVCNWCWVIRPEYKEELLTSPLSDVEEQVIEEFLLDKCIRSDDDMNSFDLLVAFYLHRGRIADAECLHNQHRERIRTKDDADILLQRTESRGKRIEDFKTFSRFGSLKCSA